jgi:hypothetical protein
MRRIVVLAPSGRSVGKPGDAIAALLACADTFPADSRSEIDLYDDQFELTPAGWPVAALTRDTDFHDAGEYTWLRADPAHFRVEHASVRMLACGDIGQSRDEADALLATLAPAFGDEGFELSAPHASRWYLRAFTANTAPDLPDLPPPEIALGSDLFELWPEDHIHRRWRRIFNETQIILAQHPVNRERLNRSQPAINGLWFWGAGRLPDKVSTRLSAVMTTDPLLSALSAFAGTVCITGFDSSRLPADGDVLVDLRQVDDVAAVLHAILEAWNDGRIRELDWRSPSGRWLRKRWHRWRFWR